MFLYQNFVFVILFLIHFHQSSTKAENTTLEPICRKNEIYTDKGETLCCPKCHYPKFIGGHGPVCTFKPGCTCDHGWVYADNGDCIPKEFCPQEGDMHVQFSECGAACQPTCDCLKEQKNISIHCRCDRTCVPGYVCDKGYVRNSTGGWCITIKECKT